MKPVIKVSHSIVEQTINYLQEAGRARSERVVLWLGRKSGLEINVVEAFLGVD
jgi:hypothetical protein